MSQPLVVVSLHEETIIETMKDQGIIDQFNAQLERIKTDPDHPYNAIVAGEFHDGQGNVRFISYHFMPGDSGWRMITVFNAMPEILEIVRQTIEMEQIGPKHLMFIDSEELRN